jgi:hypothetical protein
MLPLFFYLVHSYHSSYNHQKFRHPHLFMQDLDGYSTDEAVNVLLKLTLGLSVSQALSVFVRLRIPDLMLETRPLPIQAIAKGASCNEESLLRILRLLAAHEIVVEEPFENFRLGHTGSLLQHATADSSFACMVEYILEEPLWMAWAKLPQTLVNDTLVPFELANDGRTTSDYYSKNARALRNANTFVKFIAEWEERTCASSYEWNSITKLVDLGGNRGSTLSTIKTRYPDLDCICVDREAVVRQAPQLPGIAFLSGDMFDPSTIPACDAILMKHIILSEFDSDESIQILKSCRKALPDDGRVLIAEAVLPDHGPADPLSSQVDLFMMLDGRQRIKTVQEWKTFVSQAGFVLQEARFTGCPTCSFLVLEKD